MIYKLFAVKDKALDVFSAPFTQATVDAGLRMWRDIVMYGEENNRYQRSPQDYSLYLLGEFDEASGKTENLDNPLRVAGALEVIEKGIGPSPVGD